MLAGCPEARNHFTNKVLMFDQTYKYVCSCTCMLFRTANYIVQHYAYTRGPCTMKTYRMLNKQHRLIYLYTNRQMLLRRTSWQMQVRVDWALLSCVLACAMKSGPKYVLTKATPALRSRGNWGAHGIRVVSGATTNGSWCSVASISKYS